MPYQQQEGEEEEEGKVFKRDMHRIMLISARVIPRKECHTCAAGKKI